MVVCYTLWAMLIARLPATVAALAVMSAPVVGVSASVLLLGDSFSGYKAIALMLIVISVALTVVPHARHAVRT